MEAQCKKSVKLTPSSSSSCVITNLPNSIVMEILCRVPIRTIAASKCVCKSWLNLIQDPHFAQLHQPRSSTEVCFQCCHYVNVTKLYLGNFNFLNNFGPSDVKFSTLYEVPKFGVKPNNELSSKYINSDIHFANSCNGLLCFGSNRFAVVCNPCTREFITFPAPTVVKGVSNIRGYGFGFSTKENKYKLLRLMGRQDLADGVLAEVCTIEKACSWNKVSPCTSNVLPSGDSTTYKSGKLYATYLQGTLHWIGYSCSHKSDVTILTFDFEDDRFGSLPLPSGKTYRIGYSLWQEKLGVLAGCLSITGETDEGTGIWLMKEYGVQDSWTKLFCLGRIISKGISYDRYLPITYMDNGEVLMTCVSFASTIIFCYNPVLKSIRLIGSGHTSLRVISFRPSLVPLKDSMLGYKVHVQPRRAADTPHICWKPMKEESPQRHGASAPLTNDELSVPAVEEESQGHVNATSVVSAQETSTADLALQQGSKTVVATDESCVSATRDDPLKRIKSVMEEVLEELRKEREQRQGLEERLRNELAKVEPLKEQSEQLKQENRELEERLQVEQAKAEQLKERIQQSGQLKQENRQMTMQMMDEMRARLMGSQ